MDIKELVLSHKIYLTEKQRYSLLSVGTKIEVDGKMLAVWKKGNNTNEPCEDVVQQYYISNDFSEPFIKDFIINLPSYDSVVGLLNPKDGGHKSFRYTYKENNTTHYVIIADFDAMMESLIE